MTIPFKVKLLTNTAKAPTQENQGDLWDLYADDFCTKFLQDIPQEERVEDYCNKKMYSGVVLNSQGRILVKTGISLELPIKNDLGISTEWL